VYSPSIIYIKEDASNPVVLCGLLITCLLAPRYFDLLFPCQCSHSPYEELHKAIKGPNEKAIAVGNSVVVRLTFHLFNLHLVLLESFYED